MRSLVLLPLLVACGSSPARFPLREPIWRDTDLDPVKVACRPNKEKPGQQICRPEEYVSSFAGDGFQNLAGRPFTRLFAVKLDSEARNVNAFDETPDSSWFTNRIGRKPMTPEEVKRGPCTDDTFPTDGPDGSWLIDMGKSDGANIGFRVRLPDGRRYMFKIDAKDEIERATGATAIGTRIYWAAGWFTPCDEVVYVRPSIFSLEPGLTIKDNTGKVKVLDQKLLHEILTEANHRGELIRFSASHWVAGRSVGPFRYEGTKGDDPNDVIPHENRRDLRGVRVFAAWINHFDSREENSLTTWLAKNKDEPDSSPGLLMHYYIDLGDCFGSQWKWDQMSRRLGVAYYFDFGYVFADWFTLGTIVRPWDKAKITEDGKIFGYYSSRNFDPDGWKAGYPNPTFNEATEHDNAWGARILARFTDDDVAAAVETGQYTDPRHSAYLVRTLIERRDILLRRYFAKLSPVTDLRVEGQELCGTDLARRTRVYPQAKFAYRAELRAGRDQKALPGIAPGRTEADGSVCVALPRIAGDGGRADDDASRYLIVSLTNGQAPGRLDAYLYDLGPSKGYRLVGIRRQNP